MIKNLTKHGNSYALVIDKPILELLKATPETEFEIITDGRCLLISPVRSKAEEKKFDEALAKVHSRFGGAMKRLAEWAIAMQPCFLDIERVMRIHRSLIETYGGADGVRDVGLLQSALAMPQATFDGKFLHTDLFEMAAAYLFHIVKNHPFVDGNKRVGAATAIIFLEMNDFNVVADEDGVVDITLAAAQSQATKQQIAEFWRSHVA